MADVAGRVTSLADRVGRRRPWRAESSSTTGALLVAPAVLLVVGLVGYPLALLAVDAIGDDGRAALADLFRSEADRQALVRTIRVSVLVTGLALVLGAAVAWALRTATNRAWRAVLWIAVLAPFWMSVVVKNYAFILILRQGGPVHQALSALGLVGDRGDLLYTEGAVVVGMLYAMLPYAVLPLYAAFASLDLSLLRAAEVLGAAPGRGLVDIVLPLSARGILSAGTLVFVVCLGFYVTPVVLGGPASPFVSSLIGSDIFDYFDLASARALALVLLLIALVTVVLSQVLSRLLPSAERS